MGGSGTKEEAVNATPDTPASPSGGTTSPPTSGANTPYPRMQPSSAPPPEKETYPIVFKWQGYGRQVYVTGSFNNWKGKIPLSKSDDFSAIVHLPQGTHQYKFLVDGQWAYAPDTEVITDPMGNNCHTITVVPPIAVTPGTEVTEEQKPLEFGQMIPDLRGTEYPQEYNKEPPFLPPQLFRTVLDSVVGTDPDLLPIPAHVTLKHMYHAPQTHNKAMKGVLVFGVTHRVRGKCASTVYYLSTSRITSAAHQSLTGSAPDPPPSGEHNAIEIHSQPIDVIDPPKPAPSPPWAMPAAQRTMIEHSNSPGTLPPLEVNSFDL